MTEQIDIQTIRDACISSQTKERYQSGLNVIKGWIRGELIKAERDIQRFFTPEGELNVMEFTPHYFERFLVFQRHNVQTSTLSGYRSAIKYLYRLNNLPLPVEYGDNMKTIFSGLKRLEAEKKQTTVTARDSGKYPLTFSVYEELCKSTMHTNDKGFSHLFLISQWNLMCRSKSVETLRTHDLIVKDDSVGVVFYKTKTNQEGSGPKDPRHMYASPLNPIVCWITALALYFACNPSLPPGQIFPGNDQKNRFAKVIQSMINADSSKQFYGTHSIRKGAGTYAPGGSTISPSIVSVCLRCGWSLGGVQDRYLRYAAAGDQFLGRVVAGLPLDNANFASLPPHFKREDELMVDGHIKKIIQKCQHNMTYYQSCAYVSGHW